MKAIVTGGAGFIGSHLSRKLLQEGWDVLIVDNLSSGHHCNVPYEAEFLELDLTCEEVIKELPTKDIDVIFHLASHVGQELSFEDPIYDLKANSLSTMLLLQWCLNSHVKKFVFASSMNVYGNATTDYVDETVPVSPPSPYAVGKISSEHLCKIYQNFGIETTVFRLFNIYGPGQDLDNLRQGMVSIYMAYVARNEMLMVKGSKDRFRDFVYIEDAVDAIYRSLNKKASGKIYNVATGQKTFVWELIDLITNVFGHAPGSYPITYKDPTIQDQFGLYGNSKLIQSELGWKPEKSIEEGIRIMSEWVKKKINNNTNNINMNGIDNEKN